jgi:hypothetical protein
MTEQSSLSRRTFLQVSVSGIGALAAAPLLESITRYSETAHQQGVIDDALVISIPDGLAISALPSTLDVSSNVERAAYALALKAWLELNPDVRVVRATADQPSTYVAVPSAEARSLYYHGDIVELTPFIERYATVDRLPEPARTLWENYASMQGRYFAFPVAYQLDVVAFRRDQLLANGGTEPSLDWDYAEYQQVKALAEVERSDIRSIFNTYGRLAQREGKLLEELIGLRAIPRAANGYQEQQLDVSSVGISAYTSAPLIDRAVSLLDFMLFGEGRQIYLSALFVLSNGDLRVTYAQPLPLNGQYDIDGIPGDFAEAWGARTLQELRAVLSRRLPPSFAQFAPLNAEDQAAYARAREDYQQALDSFFGEYQPDYYAQVYSRAYQSAV